MIDWFSLLWPTSDMTHFGRLAMLGIAFFMKMGFLAPEKISKTSGIQLSKITGEKSDL